MLFCRIVSHKIFEMKKLFLMIALVAATLMLTSGFNEEAGYGGRGETAADVRLENSFGSVSLKDYRGQYVLLSFWSSEDAASRMLCANYARECGKNGKAVHLGVNFDEQKALFEAIVDADSLDAKAQYNITGKAAASLRHDYRLEGGQLGTVLIDPKGRIAAVNPTPEQIAKL